MVISGEIGLGEFIDYGLLINGIEITKWLLKTLKSENVIRKTAERIIYFTRDPKPERVDEYIKKFDLCLTNLKSLERIDEKYELVASLRQSFAYNIFPVSNYTQDWFFEVILSSTEMEIARIIDNLRSHDRVVDSLLINTKLAFFLAPKLNFSYLLDRYLKGEIPQALFFALTFTPNGRDLANLVEVLLDTLDKNVACNKVLSELVHRQLQVKIEFQSVSKWLVLTRSRKLRLDYMEGNQDLLRVYISKLPNCGDEWLYEAYVLDPLALDLAFYWHEYVKSLPRNKTKSSRYSQVIEVIRAIGADINPELDTRKMLMQCVEVANLQSVYDGNRERLIHNLQNYVGSENVFLPLMQYINFIIEKNRKKESILLPRISIVRKGYNGGALDRGMRQGNELNPSKRDFITPILLLIVMCLILAASPLLYRLLSANLADWVGLIVTIALALIAIIWLAVMLWYFF